MTDLLCLTFRFLTPLFHGRKDGGAPEWPPSPLRVMQALVATAGRAEGTSFDGSAFAWLEGLEAPTIVAPVVEHLGGYRLSVPNNAMDEVARSWGRGGDADPSKHRAMKAVKPQRLIDGDAVHYLWATGGDARHAPRLIELAKGVVALGWGLDHVVGNGEVMPAKEAAALTGSRWLPGREDAAGLRVPMEGTLTALNARHARFLTRTSLDGGSFDPTPPLSRFRMIRYLPATRGRAAPLAAFSLLRPDGSAMRAFDAARDVTRVAGMLRHAASRAAEASGWQPDRVRSLVLGHGEAPGAATHRPAPEGRLAFLPAPTIERTAKGERSGAVRRVLVASYGDGLAVEWARVNLAGRELIDEATMQAVAVLGAQDEDAVVRRFTNPSRTWVSVSPVVLPGHDDRGGLRRRLANVRRDPERQRTLLGKLNARTECLLRRALTQSGVPAEFARTAEIEWRPVPFFAGVSRADAFRVPSHLAALPRCHVRLRFSGPLSGPLCVGAGRFYGLGLLVAESAT